jgi:demethylmenaquinone methyltransferase / 2-methoxy-6-polyprenyl-1,4-benzoquinol methylase
VSNKFYQTGEQRAPRVADLFGAIATRYDLINDLQSLGFHRLWKNRLVKMAAVQPGDKALDVCCGTGDIAFALERAGAEVIGLDFSPAMLDVARQRARRAGHAAQFAAGDALNIPFGDSMFDIVTVGYGLRNLASWERGLEEMARVARPGGRLLILDFGKPDSRLWRGLYFTYLRGVVPLMGRIFCGDSDTHAYILKSLHAYPAQRGIAEKLKSMNCRDITTRNLLAGAMSIHYAQKFATGKAPPDNHIS